MDASGLILANRCDEGLSEGSLCIRFLVALRQRPWSNGDVTGRAMDELSMKSLYTARRSSIVIV